MRQISNKALAHYIRDKSECLLVMQARVFHYFRMLRIIKRKCIGLCVIFCALLFNGFYASQNADAKQLKNDLQDKLPPASDFSAFPAGFPVNPDQPKGWTILPPSRPFPSLIPDPRDLKIGFRARDIGGIEAEVGGYRSIVGWKGEIKAKDTVLHIGIEGNAYFLMQKEGERFPLESSDGMFGIYAEAQRAEYFYQFRFSHISAHLADGVFGKLSDIRFSREFVWLRVAKQISWLRPYIGYRLLVHTIPKDVKTHAIQMGFYAITPIHWANWHPYFGTDFKWSGGKEGNALNISAGFALVSDLGAPPVRLVANYFRGNSPRGQFFDQRISKVTFGFELDF